MIKFKTERNFSNFLALKKPSDEIVEKKKKEGIDKIYMFKCVEHIFWLSFKGRII